MPPTATISSWVNQGIGGNQVAGPAEYTPAKPMAGRPQRGLAAGSRHHEPAGVTTVIWLEGINDFGADTTVEAVMEGYNKGVAHLRQKMPGVRIYVATLTSALNSTIPTHGRPEVDAKRKALNEFFRTSKLFDGVIDFDRATLDGANGEVKAEYQPNSSIGGPGDKLHPNRAGYAAMANAIDLAVITGRGK